MNLKSPLRRTATIAAGALVGLAGVVALAGPASAHHPEILGGTSCVNEDLTWQVTWTIENSEDDIVGKITAVEFTPAASTLAGIAAGTELPMKGQGVVTAVQKLAESDTAASIKVTAEWDRPNMTVTQSRTSEDVTKSDAKCQTETPPTTTPPTTTPPTTTPPETTPPASEPGTPSTEPSASASTPPEEPATEPEFVYEETCETITVGITVPADWPEDITVVFETSEGDSKTVVGKIGETTTAEFPAVDGMTITATPEGYEGEGVTITYEAPSDCDGGSGGGEEEPSLPLTGAAAGSIAGGAGVLLAVGAGLFVMARRRKVKFTA